MADVAKDAIDSLVSKMERLDLTTDELAVLDAVLGAAETAAEVEGFGFRSPEPLKFGLPDLRGRMEMVIQADPFQGKGADPRKIVINHEEQ